MFSTLNWICHGEKVTCLFLLKVSEFFKLIHDCTFFVFLTVGIQNYCKLEIAVLDETSQVKSFNQ